MKKIAASVLIIFVILSSCKKGEEFPNTPVITFKSIEVTKNAAGKDEKVKIVISFTDGDGDLGYHSSGNGSPYDDTGSVYFHNYIIHRDSIHFGNWYFCTWGDEFSSGRMPFLTPDGSNKALKGDMQYDLFLPPHVTRDTLRYNIYIFDRALNRSNTVTSSSVIVTTQ